MNNQGGSWMWQLDDRCCPIRRIVVASVHLVDVNDHGVLGGITLQVEPVHIPCRTTLDERTIWLILGMMLGALKTLIGSIPAERRVLMWTREVEGIDGILPANDNDAVVAVYLC